MTNVSKDTYSMKAHCINCKEDWDIDIPIGIPIAAYEISMRCKNCGCKRTIAIRPRKKDIDNDEERM